MSAAHTPGPWALSKDGSRERNNQANCIQGADGTLIVYGQANDVDARLIAAAPELLEALNEIASGTYDIWSEGYRTQQIAIAAIAKATGEAT